MTGTDRCVQRSSGHPQTWDTLMTRRLVFPLTTHLSKLHAVEIPLASCGNASFVLVGRQPCCFVGECLPTHLLRRRIDEELPAAWLRRRVVLRRTAARQLAVAVLRTAARMGRERSAASCVVNELCGLVRTGGSYGKRCDERCPCRCTRFIRLLHARQNRLLVQFWAARVCTNLA